MEIVKFIGLLCFTWLFVEGSAPVQTVKKFIGIHPDSRPNKLVWVAFQKLTNCALCTGFWVGLIYYQDILLACIVSIASELFYRLIRLVIKP